MSDMLKQLAKPFPPNLVETVDKQGHTASYVNHAVVNEKALAVVGPHSFEVLEVLWADLPERTTKKGRVYAGGSYPVAVRARLTTEIDGVEVTVTEVGSDDDAQIKGYGDAIKTAASDAYKRCWMRLGLGLHLWSGGNRLYRALEMREEPADE